MLSLDNFETQVPAAILKRGKDYFKSGQVVSLEKTGDATWSAEVEGSETYTVEVTLKNDNKINDHFCDCPYDDDTCKHAVAVFFALREEINNLKNKPAAAPKKEVFASLLQTISLKEYQDFIRIQASKNKNFKTEFELFFADKDNRIDVEQKYTDLILKLIKKHSDKGFIDYRATSALSRETDKLLADGAAYIHKQNFKDAFALAKAVLKPLMEAVTDADDSNGSMAGSIFQAIALLQKITDANAAAITIKEQVFQFLQTELNDKLYFDYGDFGYELFAVFQSLAIQLNSATAFLHFVDAQAAKGKGEYENYRMEYFRKRKIEFLQQTGNTGEAEKLIQQSMDIVEVRAAAVNKALEKKEYAVAKTLIAEGIRIAENKKHPGTVNEWLEVLLQIAVKEKDIAAIRHYTRHFAFGRGFTANYYRQWKASYPPDEWTAVIENHIAETILQTTEKWRNERYYKPAHPPLLNNLAPIYIEEKYLDRLLASVQQETSLDIILQYHSYLVKEFPQELLAIYLPALEAYGMKADNRSQYADLVKKMQKIIKDIPAGKEKIVAVAQQLKDRFSVKPRRPAMIEELHKILG